jgi:hypothetical protein
MENLSSEFKDLIEAMLNGAHQMGYLEGFADGLSASLLINAVPDANDVDNLILSTNN